MDEDLPLEKQVLLYKKYLERYTERPDAIEKVLYILHKLQKLDITLDILAETGIGKIVNKYRKKSPSLKEKVKTLITKWRALIPDDEDSPAHNDVEENPEDVSTEVRVKTEKAESTNSCYDQDDSVGSPKAVKSESQDWKVKKEGSDRSSDDSAYTQLRDDSSKVKVKQESSEVKVKKERDPSRPHKSRSSDVDGADHIKVKKERLDDIVKQEREGSSSREKSHKKKRESHHGKLKDNEDFSHQNNSDSGCEGSYARVKMEPDEESRKQSTEQFTEPDEPSHRNNDREHHSSSSSRSSKSSHSHSSHKNTDKNSHSDHKSRSHHEKHRESGSEKKRHDDLSGKSKHEGHRSHSKEHSSGKTKVDEEKNESNDGSTSSSHGHKRCKYCGEKKQSGHVCSKRDKSRTDKRLNKHDLEEKDKKHKQDDWEMDGGNSHPPKEGGNSRPSSSSHHVSTKDVVDDDSWWDAPADEAEAAEDAIDGDATKNDTMEEEEDTEAGAMDIDDDAWWDAPAEEEKEEDACGPEAEKALDVDDDAWWDAPPVKDEEMDAPSPKHQSSSSSKSNSDKHSRDSHKSEKRSHKHSSSSHSSVKDKKENGDSKSSHKSSHSSERKDRDSSKSSKDDKHKHREKSDGREKDKSSSSKDSKHHSSSKDKHKSSKDKTESTKEKEKSSKRKVEDGGFSFEDLMIYDVLPSAKKAKIASSLEIQPKDDSSSTTKKSSHSDKSHSKSESSSSSSKHHKSHKASHSDRHKSSKSEHKSSMSSPAIASTSTAEASPEPESFSVPVPEGKVRLTKDDLLTPPPDINPNYKPLPRLDLEDTPVRRKAPGLDLSAHEVLESIGVKKNERTAVFSGKKKNYLQSVPTLIESCLSVLADNIDSLDHVGLAPYHLLQPVLQKATPEQLYSIEDCNPQFLGDTEELWQVHCGKDFRGAQLDDMETWRELYLRKYDEREEKLKRLKANISAATQARQAPVRKAKLAYVDAPVKPPRSVLRQQRKHGTAGSMGHKDPLAKLSSHGGKRERPPVPTMPGPSRRTKEVRTVAPMMQKTLKFMKNLRR